MDLFKPCPYCGKQAGQLAILTASGLFCNESCIRRYINMTPQRPWIQITTVDPNATSTVTVTVKPSKKKR